MPGLTPNQNRYQTLYGSLSMRIRAGDPQPGEDELRADINLLWACLTPLERAKLLSPNILDRKHEGPINRDFRRSDWRKAKGVTDA